MEKVCFIESESQLERLTNDYERIYFGSELCERLTPSPDEVLRIYRFAADNNAGFTLVTSWVSELEFSRIKKLFLTLEKEDILQNIEVVVNDWGVLRYINEHIASRPGLCLGRLLNKQCTDPRLTWFRNSQDIPPHHRRATADNATVLNHLMKMGISRLEFNNPLQGLERESDFPASLYYPYTIISVSRLCPVASWARSQPYRSLGSCAHECRDTVFHLRFKGYRDKLIYRGCGQFLCNPALPDNLDKLSIDRVVFQPDSDF